MQTTNVGREPTRLALERDTTGSVISYEEIERSARDYIRLRVARLVGKCGFTMSDCEDIEQEIMISLCEQLRLYDPGRGSVEQFINKVATSRIPPRLATRGAQLRDSQISSDGTGLAISGMHQQPRRPRTITPATYTDVCGQDEAVEALRDLVELPMMHGHLFEAVGASAKPSGVILAGPPGTGKTLLARAVAGECGANLEVVSGPELLNPYVGATEQALRDVFERAGRKTPSLILFDELDSIAPSRATADAHHQQSVVAQLLALLDGLEPRAGVFVLATTNRPKAIDSALRRPGRFDRVVLMKLPDQRGRAAILRHYLKPLKLDPDIDVDTLVSDIAAATNGVSGADLEYLCQTAARICVKDAILCGASSDEVRVSARHFDVALATLGYAPAHARCGDNRNSTMPSRGGVTMKAGRT